jgi:hypothetical protein
MPGIDTHRNIAAAVSQRLENASSARGEGNETQGKIRLANCVAGHAWKNAKVPSARKAPTRATTTPGERHHDASMHDVEALQADAMSNTPARGEESEARKSDTFGIDAHRLNADLVSGTKRFLDHYGHAKKREQAVEHRKHYQIAEVSFVRDDGCIDKEERFVRVDKARAQRTQERNKKDGERVKRAYNHLSSWLREMADRPRKTGSKYGSRKGGGSLVAPATLMPVEQLGVAVGSGKLITGAIRSGAMSEQPGLLPSLSPASDALALAGMSGVIGDAMEAADLALSVSSIKAQAKADLLHHREDALRFRRLLGKATAAEAEAYLAFDTAAARLISPTAEQQRADAVIRDIAIKGLGIQPVSSGVALAAQVTGYAMPVSAAAVSVVAGPLAVVAGAVDLHQARQEYLRRGAQSATAWDRKQVMASVSKDFEERSGAGVLAGAMASLDGQQDRSIRQAKREKGFAKIRAARAGAAIGGGISGTVLAGVVLGGVVAASVATPAGVVLALPILAASAALAVRSVRQHRAEHTSKWRERAAAAAIQGMTRKELEQALCKPAGDESAQVTVSLAEGEYLAGEDRFAGERTINFDVRENEYVGLHIFGLQIRDLIRDRDEKAAGPWIETLKGLGVDSVRLLAICKVASAKPVHQQLDFIKSHLAPALGMKYRMTGSQALPHPSVFLGRFQNALLAAGVEKNPLPTTSEYGRVREALVEQLGDEAEGMAAFKASIGEFLRKTEKLPASPLRSHLQAVLALDGLLASGTPLPEIDPDLAVELFSAPQYRFLRA